MSTRNVVLTDHQEHVIAGLVQSGRYQNASEVMREGLRMLEQREAEDAARLAALRAAAAVGLEAVAKGAYQTFENGAALADYLDALPTDMPLQQS